MSKDEPRVKKEWNEEIEKCVNAVLAMEYTLKDLADRQLALADRYSALAEKYNSCTDKLIAKTKALEIALEALEFYPEPFDRVVSVPGHPACIDQDRGYLAKQAIAEIKKIEKLEEK